MTFRKLPWIAVLVLVVVAGSASAQSQVRLDPNADGGLYIYSGTTRTLSLRSIAYVSYQSDYPFNEGVYVLKFDVSGIGVVLDAKLIVYFPSIWGDQSSLFWQNGASEGYYYMSSTVNGYDVAQGDFRWRRSGTRHYPNSVFGPGGGPNGIPYGGASWDIIDELNNDLPGGYSDYVIRMGGYGYSHVVQSIFTTHLGQSQSGDAQGSPMGPYILYSAAPIPEPGTLALLGLGLVSFGVAWRRKRRKA